MTMSCYRVVCAKLPFAAVSDNIGVAGRWWLQAVPSPPFLLAVRDARVFRQRKPRGCTNKILPAAVPPLRLSRRLRRRLNGY